MLPEPKLIAIADDHPYFRKGLIEILSDYNEMKVIIEASTGRQLLENITAAKTLPNICLLDLKMPDMNGYDALLSIKKKWPAMHVIVLSMFDHEYAIATAFKNGAAAFIPKGGEPRELRHILNEVYSNGYYHDNLSRDHINRLIHPKDTLEDHITPREKEFLIYNCSDCHYSDIANLMSVSPHTVDGYRDSLFKKLKVNTRAGLVTFAMQNGLV